MASNVDDTEHVRSDFRNANDVFNEIKEDFFNNSPHFCIRSWGMSHDYRIAIDEGSNMVRVGTAIFGERNYGL